MNLYQTGVYLVETEPTGFNLLKVIGPFNDDLPVLYTYCLSLIQDPGNQTIRTLRGTKNDARP